MTDLRQAAQQALEALGSGNPYHQQLAAKVLRTALEQQAEPVCPKCKAAVLYECVACSSNNYPPKQQAEPVACQSCQDIGGNWAWKCNLCGEVDESREPEPPQRQWVGLEIEEVQDSYNSDYQAQTRAVERILKERNT